MGVVESAVVFELLEAARLRRIRPEPKLPQNSLARASSYVDRVDVLDDGSTLDLDGYDVWVKLDNILDDFADPVVVEQGAHLFTGLRHDQKATKHLLDEVF